jgi:hypothetical protein
MRNCRMIYTLKGEVSSVDISTKENLEKLTKVAEVLLKKPVSRVNLDTGNFEPSKLESNEQALIRCKIILTIFVLNFPVGIYKEISFNNI